MSDVLIHIVDDDAAMRESLAFLLGAADFASRAYESAEALLARSDALEPGVILTDVRMPGLNGLELIQELRRRGVVLPVIVLTGHADVALAVDAMKAGVSDFLEKPYNDEALLSAIGAALKRADSATERQAERADTEERLAQLTGRERDVFDAIVAGESNKSAALKLGISPRTVEIYRANVMTKMRAQSLSDLVRMAISLER